MWKVFLKNYVDCQLNKNALDASSDGNYDVV